MGRDQQHVDTCDHDWQFRNSLNSEHDWPHHECSNCEAISTDGGETINPLLTPDGADKAHDRPSAPGEQTVTSSIETPLAGETPEISLDEPALSFLQDY